MADDLRYLTETTPVHTDFDSVTNQITSSSLDSGDMDDGYQKLTLGFEFPFGGEKYSFVYVDTNGRVIFTNETDFSNARLSNSNTERGMYPYWDDLTVKYDGNITYGRLDADTSSDRYVVSWNEVEHYNNWSSGKGSYSFQIILYRDGKIRFRYKDGDDADGSSATIGVKEDDSYYNEHTYNDSSTLDRTKDILYTPTTISGHVYEDSNGDSQMGDAVAVQDANVTLYDSGGTVLDRNLTDSNGAYHFYAPVAETCYVVVDSTTVSSQQSFNSGSDQGDIWAEQTYGGAGAQCADGSGGTTTRSSAGSCFGGRRGDISDDPTTLNDAEHRIEIDTSTTGSTVTDRDFAFSFNAVTSIRDNGDDDGSADRTIQGSLRQLIQNANALSGANAMRFVPSVAKNGININCWKITLSSALPQLSDASTTIDGTAYSLSNGTNIDNSNSGTQAMSGHVVGAGTDAVENSGDEAHLPTYEHKELEIDGGGATNILDCTQGSITVEDLAIYHGNTALKMNNSSDDNTFQRLYLGVRANGSDPGSGNYLNGAERSTSGATNEKILDSYIAFINSTAVYFSGTGEIHGNYFYGNATNNQNNDAITLEGNSNKRSVILRNNYIDGAKGYGVESWNTGGGFTIEHNTVVNTGTQGVENGGIRIFGNESTLRYNIVKGVQGAGVVLAKAGNENIIKHNVIYGNGGLSIDLDQTHSSGNPNGDGVSANNGSTDSAKQNDDMDYPVIAAATYDGSTLHIEGYVGSSAGQSAFGNADLEIYKADDDGNNDGEIVAGDGASAAHGEGKEFLFDTCQTDASGNFSCDYAVGGLDTTTKLTATATLNSHGTSEFGANKEISLLPNMHITKTSCVIDDPVNTTNPKRIPGATIRYAIEVSNTGLGQAQNVKAEDNISNHFDASTITNLQIDGSHTCNCSSPTSPGSNGSNGGVSGNTVTLDYDTVDAGATECGYFEVKIK